MTSPKQPTAKTRRDWYPYYAGFTEEFVESTVLTSLDDAGSVLDPWSGSGTTTAVCARLGLTSTGVDINPALTIIARARLTPRSTRHSLLPMGRKIIEAARDTPPVATDGDPLTRWFHPRSAARVRTTQESINELLTDEWREIDVVRDRTWFSVPDNLPVLACFFYSALFATVRDLLTRFRTTNPMWLMEPATYRNRIGPNWDTLSSTFLARIECLRNRLSIKGDEPHLEKTSFQTASANRLPFASDEFNASLTSPPYATRIDYVKGTLPELIVLGATDEAIAALRRSTTGTPVVAGIARTESPELTSPTGEKLVQRIRNHSSKGSARYYGPWMRNYLLGLQGGLAETSRVVAAKGSIAVVVQDSYYKSCHVDLQGIVSEVMDALDRGLVDRKDYPAIHLRSKMNPNARRHLANRKNTESVMVFK